MPSQFKVLTHEMGDYINPEGTSPLAPLEGVPGITLPGDFALEAADRSLDGSENIGSKPQPLPAPKSEHVRFPSRDATIYGEAIARLVGAFSGPGFNLIFRPHTDKTPPDAPKCLKLPENDLLELNLTHELWTFPSVKTDLGGIPNRVAEPGPSEAGKIRKDVFLRGIPYTQIVRDVTDTSNDFKGRRIPVTRLGKSIDKALQGQIQDIHFEPGLFIHVPDSTPVSDKPTISRMASIPHGTTINAQGLAATRLDGTAPPNIQFNPEASKPFFLDNKGVVTFFDKDQFDLNNKGATRLPQDLEPFLAKNSIESITPKMVEDPNHLIQKHNENKTFSQVIKFKVSTLPDQMLSKQSCPHLAARSAMNAAVEQINKIASTSSADDKNQLTTAINTLLGGLKLIETPTANLPNGPDQVNLEALREAATAPAIGSANIAFLDGDLGDGTNPNAKTAKVESTFWISTVVYTIEVKENFVPGMDPTGKPKFLPPLDPIPTSSWAKDTVPQFVFPSNKPIEAGKYIVEATQIQYSQTVDLIFNTLAWPHISVATLVPVRPIVVNFAKRIA
jgi:hypothetical protein